MKFEYRMMISLLNVIACASVDRIPPDRSERYVKSLEDLAREFQAEEDSGGALEMYQEYGDGSLGERSFHGQLEDVLLAIGALLLGEPRTFTVLNHSTGRQFRLNQATDGTLTFEECEAT